MRSYYPVKLVMRVWKRCCSLRLEPAWRALSLNIVQSRARESVPGTVLGSLSEKVLPEKATSVKKQTCMLETGGAPDAFFISAMQGQISFA